MLTEEQLALRRSGITATDVAKIVGQSPYGCAEDVRLDKMGVGRPFIPNERVKWGNLLEGPIRDDYAQRHGVDIVSGDDIGTLTHPTEPWAMATPDGIVHIPWEKPQVRLLNLDRNGNRPIRGWEGKTHTSWLSHLYGDPGSDVVPPWEFIQCAWNIWVCSAHYGIQIDRWDLTVFLDGLPVDYTIHRDSELELALVEASRQFHEVHVLGGEPVPPDGSEAYSEILALRWPKHEPGEIIEATAEHLETIGRLKTLRDHRKELEESEEAAKQQLKLAIGSAEAIQWAEGAKTKKITWKRSRDSERIDYKALSEDLRGLIERSELDAMTPGEIAEELDRLEALRSYVKPGSRPFNVPRGWSKK